MHRLRRLPIPRGERFCRDGTRRPRRLSKEGIEAMDRWLSMLRKALERNYDRLDAVLSTMDFNAKGKRK